MVYGILYLLSWQFQLSCYLVSAAKTLNCLGKKKIYTYLAFYRVYCKTDIVQKRRKCELIYMHTFAIGNSKRNQSLQDSVDISFF